MESAYSSIWSPPEAAAEPPGVEGGQREGGRRQRGQSGFETALQELGYAKPRPAPDYAKIGEEVMRRAASLGLRRSSGRRSPSQNAAAGGAAGSYHLSGDALDFDGDEAALRAFTEGVARDYGDDLEELFYDPVGGWKKGRYVGAIGEHRDHVHLAFPGAAKLSEPAAPSAFESALQEMGYDGEGSGFERAAREMEEKYRKPADWSPDAPVTNENARAMVEELKRGYHLDNAVMQPEGMTGAVPVGRGVGAVRSVRVSDAANLKPDEWRRRTLAEIGFHPEDAEKEPFEFGISEDEIRQRIAARGGNLDVDIPLADYDYLRQRAEEANRRRAELAASEGLVIGGHVFTDPHGGTVTQGAGGKTVSERPQQFLSTDKPPDKQGVLQFPILEQAVKARNATASPDESLPVSLYRDADALALGVVDAATRPFQYLSTLVSGTQRKIGASIAGVFDEESAKLAEGEYSWLNVLDAAAERLYTGNTRPGFEQPVGELAKLAVEQYGGNPDEAVTQFIIDTLALGTDPTTYLGMEAAPKPRAARPVTTPRAVVSSVDDAAKRAATSPANDLALPTVRQLEAGNYPKGHARLGGLELSIENPAGSHRRPEWPALKSHYGYIRRTKGGDGEHIDAFIKKGTPDDYNGPVFVVDQVKKGGGFDEHKVMLGFSDEAAARAGYLENYTPGWQMGEMRRFDSVAEFKEWLKTADTTKPAASAESLSMRQALMIATQNNKPLREVLEAVDGSGNAPSAFQRALDELTAERPLPQGFKESERGFVGAGGGKQPKVKDYSFADRFRSRLSNLDDAGVYERKGGTLGREASELMREAQILIERGEIDRAAGLRVVRQRVDEIAEQLEARGKPGLAEALQRHVTRIEGKPTEFELRIGDAIRAVPGLRRVIKEPDYAFRNTLGAIRSVNHALRVRWNVKSIAVNELQPLMTLWPHIKTSDFARALVTARSPKFRQRMAELGVFDTGAKVEGVSQRAAAGVRGWVTNPFAKASETNRAVGYAAGEISGRRLGLSGDDLHRHAMDFAKRTEFDNSAWDVPDILSSPVAQTVGQYKAFPMKNLENWGRVLKWRQGDTLKSWTARNAKFHTAVAAQGGIKATGATLGLELVGVPVYETVQLLTGAIMETGIFERDTAEKMAQTVVFGAPALGGFDISASVALLDEPFGYTIGEKALNTLGGSNVSTAIEMAKAGAAVVGAETPEQRTAAVKRAAGKATPYYKTVDMARQMIENKGAGATVEIGRDRIELSPKEATGRGLGFTPLKQTLHFQRQDERRNKAAEKRERKEAERAAREAFVTDELDRLKLALPEPQRKPDESDESFAKTAKASRKGFIESLTRLMQSDVFQYSSDEEKRLLLEERIESLLERRSQRE